MAVAVAIAKHAAAKEAGGPPAISRIVRMSPQISPSPTVAGGWATPAQMSVAAFQYLCTIGMDALKPFDITYIAPGHGVAIGAGSVNSFARGMSLTIRSSTVDQAEPATLPQRQMFRLRRIGQLSNE